MRWIGTAALAALMMVSACEGEDTADGGDDTTSGDVAAEVDTVAEDATTDSAEVDSAEDTVEPEPPRVTLDVGEVEGVRGDGHAVFWGIPFAKPPVGALRWAPPEPAEPWSETLVADTRPAQCPQPEGFGSTLEDSEDCLYLNVWTPDPLPEDAPVLVWIHGGGFLTGSGAQNLWDGTFIAPEGAVLVTINYRLGPLGFLAHPEFGEGNGNFGFMDQQRALGWVQDHIAAFGGDPANVTLFGESAGAFSVCAHLAAPDSAGLFQRAILQSGTCNAISMAEAEAPGLALEEALSCADAADAVACMREATAADIAAATPAAEGFFFGDGATWQPVIDGDVFPDDPLALLTSSDPSIEIIIGSNADEGTIFLALAQLELDETSYATTVEAAFGEDATAILERYPASAYESPNAAMAEVLGDGVFVCPARRLTRFLAGRGHSVWLYHFTRVVSWPFFPGLGAYHSAELQFIFQIPMPGVMLTAEDRSLGEAMLGYWLRFAGQGDPNGDGAASWEAYSAEADNHIVFNLPVESSSGLESEACDFWDGLL